VFPDSFKKINDPSAVGNQTMATLSNPVADGFHELLEKNRVLETENHALQERLRLAET
jgi:regulator of replication initiation timing